MMGIGIIGIGVMGMGIMGIRNQSQDSNDCDLMKLLNKIVSHISSNCNKVKKIKSSMAKSLSVENLLPQNVESIISSPINYQLPVAPCSNY